MIVKKDFSNYNVVSLFQGISCRSTVMNSITMPWHFSMCYLQLGNICFGFSSKKIMIYFPRYTNSQSTVGAMDSSGPEWNKLSISVFDEIHEWRFLIHCWKYRCNCEMWNPWNGMNQCISVRVPIKDMNILNMWMSLHWNWSTQPIHSGCKKPLCDIIPSQIAME